jgi:hypothetical protein
MPEMPNRPPNAATVIRVARFIFLLPEHERFPHGFLQK